MRPPLRTISVPVTVKFRKGIDDQLLTFLTPDGELENFCADGVCDASEPSEIPFGDAAPCDPLG